MNNHSITVSTFHPLLRLVGLAPTILPVRSGVCFFYTTVSELVFIVHRHTLPPNVTPNSRDGIRTREAYAWHLKCHPFDRSGTLLNGFFITQINHTADH